MGDQITTYSKVLTHPFNVSFTCEHCGECNSFTQEIVGAGKKSIYGSSSRSNNVSTLSAADSAKMLLKAEKALELGIKNAETKLAKGKYSWLYANKCTKCKHYQSWQTSQIWKTFFKSFFGGPFMLMLLVFFPLNIIFGKDTNKYPEWIMIVMSSLIFIIWISSIIILIKSLLSRDRKHRCKPIVTL